MPIVEPLQTALRFRKIMTNLIFTSLLPQNFAEFIHFFGIDSSIKHRIDAEKGTQSDGHAALADANRALAPADTRLIIQRNASSIH